MSAGHMFLSASIAAGNVSEFLGHGPIEKLFRDNEIETYKVVRDFVKKFGALPTVDTVEAHTGESLQKHKEPAGYYLELMQSRDIEKKVKGAMQQAQDYLSVENKKPALALEILSDMVIGLAQQKQAKKVLDFRQAYDLIIPTYVTNFHGNLPGLEFGWPTLDDMTGGVRNGDLVSFVGRPMAGKTWQMLHSAMYGWNKSAKLALAGAKVAGADGEAEPVHPQSRMFVSMEMATLPIQQRMAAMQTHVGIGGLKQSNLGSDMFGQLKKGLTEIKGFGAPFWVVDGNLAATVEDIWMLARQLKPDGIFIDGGYLVKHPTERDRFRRVAENVELMKQELTPLAPTTVSWQFAKSASKKKKGEKVDGDDIGYSDAIFQVSSLVAGFFQAESVETIHQRRAEILKGRSGETGGFNTMWDFDKMLFDEVVETAISDLQFL